MRKYLVMESIRPLALYKLVRYVIGYLERYLDEQIKSF